MNTQTIAVIHAAYEDAPQTVAMVEVPKDVTVAKKLDLAFMLTNNIAITIRSKIHVIATAYDNYSIIFFRKNKKNRINRLYIYCSIVNGCSSV